APLFPGAARWGGGRRGLLPGLLRGLGAVVWARHRPPPPPGPAVPMVPAMPASWVEEKVGGLEEAEHEEPMLSFSAISAYRECPRQHWYRYRLRLPTAPGVEAQFGTALHLALMRAGRLRAEGGEVTAELLREL